ncbi:MAG TPA: polysaccharide deacetylase family protein [Capillimicrobium sp.]|nr:polysaccharide deacetylase family protein [Capillimicrobium sp.]
MRLRGHPWRNDVRNRARRALARHHGAVAVLLYHRVADTPRDPQQLAVAPERFAAHLEVLAATCTPVALGEAVARLRSPRGLPPRAVAVTFDDGYRDNLHTAKPLLERHGVPATVFVASGYVGAGREFWWDELESLLLDEPTAGRAATVAVDGDVHAVATEAERRTAYDRLAAALRPATVERRDAILRALREWAGESPDGRRRSDRLAVDPDELRRLDGGAVRVGAHTRHHLSLAAHPPAVQREEIAAGATDLSAWLGRPIDLFAYPFGSPADVGDATVAAAREAGFALSAINQPGLATALTGRHAVPRFLVRDWPADRFEAWLQTEVLAT